MEAQQRVMHGVGARIVMPDIERADGGVTRETRQNSRAATNVLTLGNASVSQDHFVLRLGMETLNKSLARVFGRRECAESLRSCSA